MNRKIKGIFCHDLRIYKDKNGVYCSTTLTNDLFQRYFCAVDELTVATRVCDIDCTYEEAHQERITLPNLKMIEMPDLNTLKGLITEQRYVRKILAQEIRNSDLIFIRGGMIALVAADVARKLKKPYLIECGGCAWEGYWYHGLKGKLMAPYMEYRARKDVKEASYVIYVTEKWLQKRYPTNAKYTTYASNVILAHIDHSVLTKRIEKIKNRNKENSIILGTTAAINNKAKGQKYVIEMIGNLSSNINVRYEMVGEGDAEYLRSIASKYNISDKIVFKGQLNHDEILEWLDSIDMYIQPSMQEGLPRALIEAMSRGCPAIGSGVAGIPELLQKEAIFKAGKVDQLEKTFLKMISRDVTEYAKKNFFKASEYELKKLNGRRSEIYRKYRDDVVEVEEDEMCLY